MTKRFTTKRVLTLLTVAFLATTVAQSSFESRVAQNVDDAEEFSGETSQGPAGTVYLDSSDLELFEDAGTLQVVGLRFENVSVPQGAVVTAAYLQFTVDETTDKDTSVDIQAEASDSAPVFSEASGDLSNRSRTTAAVTWTPAPWTKVGDAGPDQQSPDLTAVVQEIVNRPGWQSGNALAFILSGTGHRVARSFDGKKSEAALLRIDYETAAGTPPTDGANAETTPQATPEETTPDETTPAETAPAETVETQSADTAATPVPATPAPEPAPTPSASPAESPRNRQVRYPVLQVGDSRVRGSLFVADYGDKSLVLTLFVTGQAASDTLGAELRQGNCGSDGATLLTLEPSQGDRGGLSVTTLQMSFVALTNADLHVNLTADGADTVLACGEVGAP